MKTEGGKKNPMHLMELLKSNSAKTVMNCSKMQAYKTLQMSKIRMLHHKYNKTHFDLLFNMINVVTTLSNKMKRIKNATFVTLLKCQLII
jgi:hypothetical protein